MKLINHIANAFVAGFDGQLFGFRFTEFFDGIGLLLNGTDLGAPSGLPELVALAFDFLDDFAHAHDPGLAGAALNLSELLRDMGGFFAANSA